jgi:hypothetical protein
MTPLDMGFHAQGVDILQEGGSGYEAVAPQHDGGPAGEKMGYPQGARHQVTEDGGRCEGLVCRGRGLCQHHH